jgi:signal peptidase I, bacterial type
MSQPVISDVRASRTVFSEVIRWIVQVCVVISLALLVIWCYGVRVEVSGHSMEPSLNEGEVVLIDRVAYLMGDVERFDAVGFYKDGELIIKRAVGLPGETVQIVNGEVLINGAVEKLPEYMAYYLVPGLADAPLQLAEDEYFFLGDNGESSEDSRFQTIGKVKRDVISGKVWFRISPFKALGRITK